MKDPSCLEFALRKRRTQACVGSSLYQFEHASGQFFARCATFGPSRNLMVAWRYGGFMGFLFLGLFVLLFLAWIFSFFVFHITGGLIHILLILAVISIIVHFARRASHGHA